MRPLRKTLLFLFLWLMVGYSLGTAVLLGPVRWFTLFTRKADWSQSSEDLSVRGIIVLFVVLSAIIALWFTRVVVRTELACIRFAIPFLSLICAAGAVWLWMTPTIMDYAVNTTDAGVHFTFGVYPTEDKLRELKQENYTAVISLLHPAVVPFEPLLIKKEQEASRRVGIELIHLPMLPWVGDNREPIERIRELASSRSGRYYVHCYLGKDRVHLVKRIIEQIELSIGIELETPSRGFMEQGHFERGKIYLLSEGVYLTPYPTDEEFLAFFLTGQVNQVVTLMDPDIPGEREWIEKEELLLSEHDITMNILTVKSRDYDPYRVVEIAKKVRGLPRPVVVHAFLSSSTGRSPVAEAFLQAFRSNLPPLPPSRFAEPLLRGPVKVLAPNIAAGPRPQPEEFGSFLYRNGLREFIYIGDPTHPEAVEDRMLTSEHGFNWRAWTDSYAGLEKLLAAGGPWYIYGPNTQDIINRIGKRFGPPIPERVTWNASSFYRNSPVGWGREK